MSRKMMTRFLSLICLLSVAGALGACTEQRSVYGEEKKAPDEFAVYSRAPLSLPPDFGLRPPKPGASRPQQVAPRNEAKQALLGDQAAPTAGQASAPQSAPGEFSPGMLALIRESGADKADPNIRALVNSETVALSGSESVADTILFWREGDKTLKGAVLDPNAEAKRLRSKGIEGDTVVEDAPRIQRRGGGETQRGKEKGFWGGLFD